MKKVYVILVNWNNWIDTVECLTSLFCSKYSEYKVIVCDNGSTDGSFDRIKDWALGKELENYTIKTDFNLNCNCIGKPIQFEEYRKAEIETGFLGQNNFQLVLIKNDANLGFAGGNNIGIKYAITKGDYEYIWLLNNDTVIETDTLNNLIKSMQNDPQIGIAGSKLLDYDKPHSLQAFGGTIDRLTARAKLITDLSSLTKIDYIVGASFMISKDCINTIGLLPEEYFLYYEETDYCFKARYAGFKLAVSLDSVVYHKEGRATGVSREPKKKSEYSDLLIIRNRIVFARKYKFPMIFVYFGTLYSVLLRLMRGQVKRGVKIVLLMVGFRNVLTK